MDENYIHIAYLILEFLKTNVANLPFDAQISSIVCNLMKMCEKLYNQSKFSYIKCLIEVLNGVK